ncbi:MAG: acetylpolyamine amidohydrolase [Candidatus Margulisiibacteriota bacterium]
MFRVRQIYDDSLPINQRAIAEVQKILAEQFPLLTEADINKIPEQLKNPLKYHFRTTLFVADDMKAQVKAFAVLMHAPDMQFCFLDYISICKRYSGKGIGGILFERVREEAVFLKCKALFFECLPDDPSLSKDPQILKQNSRRLKFFEQFGVRPLTNTRYATPVKEGGDNPPYFMVDTLGKPISFSREDMRKIVRAILNRKYSDICNKAYVDMVVESIQDDPVQLRPFRYIKQDQAKNTTGTSLPKDRLIKLTYNDRHAIHNVKERGYVEAPVRVATILNALQKTETFDEEAVRHFSDRHILAVHDSRFVDYLRAACKNVPPNESIYPYVFPIRNNTRPPKDLPMRAGYYCMDTFTPLNQNAYLAARYAVDCTLTAADTLLHGTYLAYSLVRPPGHHAENNIFGGFCYFNSTAIAANYLSKHGKVAILDIDYHHGNGQQYIFYKRSDILTVSIHGHPHFTFPFFSGFAEERGYGEGLGFNINYPLPENVATDKYINTLKTAIHHIRRFQPHILVVALGFDTALGDPTGTWSLKKNDYETIGSLIGDLPYPTLFVQEGGYKTQTLGKNAAGFFEGVWKGSFLPDA